MDDDRTATGNGRARGVAGLVAALVLGLLLGALAWGVVTLRPFSVGATLAVLATGGAAAGAGARQRRRRGPRRARPATRLPAAARARALAGAGPWVALILAGATWQVAAYVQHPRSDHPTLSSLVNAALDSHPARAAAFVAWLAGAWELARR